MQKIIYPALFSLEADGGYSITFPDLEGCNTEGDTLEEALEMAKDALGIYLYTLNQDNKTFPIASKPEEMKLKQGQFMALIDWDEVAYLKKVDSKAVKKTLTIPSWLNHLATEQEINFSQVLQEGLKKELKIS